MWAFGGDDENAAAELIGETELDGLAGEQDHGGAGLEHGLAACEEGLAILDTIDGEAGEHAHEFAALAFAARGGEAVPAVHPDVEADGEALLEGGAGEGGGHGDYFFHTGVFGAGSCRDIGVDEEEQAAGSDLRHFFGDEDAGAGAAAPVDPTWIFAAAVFFEAVEFVDAATARAHGGAGFFGGEAEGEEARIDGGDGGDYEDGVMLATHDGAFDEAEGEAGAELVLVESLEAAAFGDDFDGDGGGGAGGGVEEVALWLAGEAIDAVELGKGDGEAGPEFFIVVEMIDEGGGLADDGVFGKLAGDAEMIGDHSADEIADDEDADHQPANAVEEVCFA